jgi:RNA polymerase sigma factor (sigma-70 family)
VPELLSELLVRCRARDESAVAELVRRFRPWAIDFAAALLGGDVHAAEDAVQVAFVNALSRLNDLREPSAFAGWFRQIVRTEANRIARRRHEVRRNVERAQPSPLDVAVTDERSAVVRRAIEERPKRSGEAAALHYLDELAVREIADRLSIPTGTVKRRLHDAREKLRERLKNQLPL